MPPDRPANCFTRTLTGRPALLAPLRSSFRTWLDDHGVPQETIDDLVLACNEACSNAIEHAYDMNDGTIEVAAECSSSVVVMTVRDHGVWRDIPAPGERGRGLDLIRAVVDDLAIDRTPSGTRVTMRRAVETP